MASASDADERRPLLNNGQNDNAAPSKLLYSSVDVVPTNEDSTEVQDVSAIEAAEALAVKEANVRMSKLIIPLGLGVLLAAMDQTIVASSYASIGSELKQLQKTSWVATGYMLTLTSFQPLYGKMSDIFGRKGCLLFAYAVFGVGCLLCGLARNMTELIVARAIAGLGGGGMSTVVTILVSDIVPLRSRGTWQGILNLIFATGSAAGAPLGGLLADSIGWRWAFLIQVPFAFLAFVIVFFALHLPRKELPTDLASKLRRIDFLGALTLVTGIFALLFGLDRGGNISWSSRLTIGSLTLSFVLLALFALTETRIAVEPFAPARVLMHPSLLAAYLCNLLGIGAAMCVVFHTALYLQAAGGASAARAGLGLLPAVFGGVTGSLSSGLLMQKTGRYYWLTVGAYGAETIGTTLMALATWVKGGVITAEVGLLVQALGNGSGVTTTLIAIIANAAPEDQAIATAISYLFRSLGSVLGISIGSTLVQNSLRSYLHDRLAGEDVDVDDIVERARASLASISSLPPAIQAIVRASYAEAVRTAFLFAFVLACSAFLCSFFVREKPLARKKS
ncbi:major facilitator superfamily domain-containing protein [Phellopilus nigrolimitatus]|nr:major facilitator superfamily domain-containing protein [Phellopilus nigrolimitatus]